MNLASYYKTNFGLRQHHNYSLRELEDMIPWEREIYIALLLQHLKDVEDRRKQQSNNSGY